MDTSPLTPQQQRALRRRHKHERQAVIFGSLVAGLALAGFGATAVYTGAMDAPFLDRSFTTPSPEPTGTALIVPCPPEGAVAVTPAEIATNVLNSTGQIGLAASTAREVAANGMGVLTTGNYAGVAVVGTAELHFGVAGLAAAYTLAAHIDGAVLSLDQRADASVDLIVGDQWTGFLAADQVTLAPGAPLEAAPECIPYEQAVEIAPPGPAPAPAPTTTPTAPPA